MDSTISVSKGCFVFKNGATRADKTTKKPYKRGKKHGTQSSTVLGKEITEQQFYEVYAETWQSFMQDIEELHRASYAKTLEDLVDYVANDGGSTALEQFGVEEILPAAALLTGINQPDHLEQFETLSQRINERISASVCVLQSRDCPTIKAAIESMVYNFIEAPLEEDEEEDRDHKRLRRSQCTMKQLAQWYLNNYASNGPSEQQDDDDEVDPLDDASVSTSAAANKRHTLVVILPDFECFSSSVLQDLILILSSYCARLPFVLIMGVATAVSAVHSALPYHVTSKIKLKIFQTQAAPKGLNEILDKVLLSPKFSFHLSGKALKFLTHIFLYYDFSINGFIQGFKYCLMEHFFKGNAYALCCNYTDSLIRIRSMTHEDMETIRRLLSFRPYVEAMTDCKRIIAILTEDDYLKKKLPQLLRDCHIHFILFRAFLELFTLLVQDLPKCPLGKQRRELYTICLSKPITAEPEFKECWQMLSFLSKEEFLAKFEAAIKATEDFVQTEAFSSHVLADECLPVINETLSSIKELVEKVHTAGLNIQDPDVAATKTSPEELKQLTRHDLKEKLLQMSKKAKPVSEFSKAVNNTLDYVLSDVVTKHLRPLSEAPPLHELFVFSDIASVRRNIIGAPRAALHMALNNPHFYLQCKCCVLSENSQLLSTLPDLSVAYKLHLECGRMINLFDWLQAFRSVVDSNEDDQEQVDPQIQARFTRAVAELQFLGYIKMSKRKTDHATRLTW